MAPLQCVHAESTDSLNYHASCVAIFSFDLKRQLKAMLERWRCRRQNRSSSLTLPPLNLIGCA